MKNVWFFLFFLTIATSSWSQQTRIDPIIFDKSDGFDLSYVNSIVADNDGFMWLGGSNQKISKIFGTNTKLTLQRFNGTSFDKVIIPQNAGKVINLNHIFKRADGKFYLSLQLEKKERIVLFDPITTKFTYFKNPVFKKARTSISAIYKHRNKNYVLMQDGEKVTQFHLKDDLSFEPLFSFIYSAQKFSLEKARIIMNDKHCIISTKNMPPHAFNWQGKLLRTYSPSDFGIENVFSSSQTYIDECFIQKKQLYFFLLNNPQLFTLNLNTLKVNQVKDFVMPSKNLYVLEKGPDKLIVNRNDERLTVTKVIQSGPDIELDTIIDVPNFGKVSVHNAFSRNLTNELWIVTDEQRLLYYNIEEKPINSVLTNNAIRAIHPLGANEILVATDGNGWYSVNHKTKKAKPFSLQHEGTELLPSSSRAFFKEGDIIWTTHYSKMMSLNMLTKQVFLSKQYPISCLDRRSTTQFIYGTNSHQLVQYNTDGDQHETLLTTDSLDIIDLKVHDDWVIAGTNKGLLLYQFSTKKHQLIQKNKQLTDAYILSVSTISKGKFALGTKFGKLFTFEVKSKKIELVYEDELNAGIANMLIDDKKRWWLSTFNGLVCFDPKTKKINRYSTANGLSNNEANRYSSLKIGKTLFFGSYKGLNYFSTDLLKPEIDSAQLVLMMSEVFNPDKNQFQTNKNRRILNEQTHFHVPASQRSLKMRFAVQERKVSGKYTINYRLNDDRWSTLDQMNELNFSNLASGNYNLEIILLDFSGKQVGQPLIYNIDVDRFFYETIWFYLLITFMGVIIFTWYYIQLRKQAKMRENFSEDLIHLQESERARISKELHDSVGQQLTLLKKTAQNRDQTEISILANNTLEEVRSISKNLHPPLLTELGLTESIRALIHAFDEETDLFFTVELLNIDAYFDPKQALQIYRFIQEGLSNLLKHAKAKTAYIKISIVDEKIIKIRIEDDGIGIKSGAKNFSLGLTTMQERIRILNGNFIIEKPKKGTKLIAKIPIA